MKTKSILLLLAMLMLCPMTFAQQSIMQQNEYGCKYRNGELIVKFKESSGVKVQRNKKGTVITSRVATVDAVLMDSLNFFEIENLMPLTGKRVFPRKVRMANGSLRGDRDLSGLYLIHYDNMQVQDLRLQQEQNLKLFGLL